MTKKTQQKHFKNKIMSKFNLSQKIENLEVLLIRAEIAALGLGIKAQEFIPISLHIADVRKGVGIIRAPNAQQSNEVMKEINRLLNEGIEIHPNSPIHEKLKKAMRTDS
jgi:hypothetical protein